MNLSQRDITERLIADRQERAERLAALIAIANENSYGEVMAGAKSFGEHFDEVRKRRSFAGTADWKYL